MPNSLTQYDIAWQGRIKIIIQTRKKADWFNFHFGDQMRSQKKGNPIYVRNFVAIYLFSIFLCLRSSNIGMRYYIKLVCNNIYGTMAPRSSEVY